MAAASATTFMLCVLIVVSNFLSSPCNANPEVDALIDVKKMVLRDPLNVLQTWQPFSDDPCNWMHVTCDADNHVHSVELGHQKLYGALSPRIADLQSLEKLDLSYNSFFGILPTSLGNLKRLRNLDLSHNQFSGQIPPSLGQIKRLRLLYLQFNKFSGRVPTDGSLSSFGYLTFEGNPDLCGAVVQRKCPKRSLIP